MLPAGELGFECGAAQETASAKLLTSHTHRDIRGWSCPRVVMARGEAAVILLKDSMCLGPKCFVDGLHNYVQVRFSILCIRVMLWSEKQWPSKICMLKS